MKEPGGRESVLPLRSRIHSHLLRLLLRSGTTGVSPQVCGFNSLAANAFDSLPSLSDSRRHVGVLDLLVDSGTELAKSSLNKIALLVTGAKEEGVDGQQNPSTLGESQGREKEPRPESNLEGGHQSHGGIIVFFDELSNGIAKRRLRFGGTGGSRSGACRLLWWLEGRDQIGASIGGYMEDGVDREGQQSQRNLPGVEPNQADDCRVR